MTPDGDALAWVSQGGQGGQGACLPPGMQLSDHARQQRQAPAPAQHAQPPGAPAGLWRGRGSSLQRQAGKARPLYQAAGGRHRNADANGSYNSMRRV